MSRIRSQISYYDLTGGLNNVSTPDSLNSTPKKTETPDIVNVEFFKLGGIKSMEGNIAIGDQQDSAIVGGWEYSKGNNKYMVIALRTGEIKIFDAASETFIQIYKFAHPSERVSFCNMNNGVVFTNGIDEPMFYEYGRRQSLTGVVATTQESTTITGTGTEFTKELNVGDTIQLGTDTDTTYAITDITSDTSLTVDIEATETLSDLNIYLSTISSCNATLINTDPEALFSPDKPIRGTAIQFYAGRLWIGGANGLFYSGVGEYNKWDEYANDAGQIAEIYNDTSDIKALGLYSDYMLIHKEYNTYLLTMTGDSETISVKPYSNVSCDSQQSWVVSNTKYYVYSRENMDIFPLSQRTIYSDRYLGDAITNRVRNVFQNLRDADLEKIFCVVLPRKRWMLFYMPMVDQLGSSYALIYDFQCKAFVVRKVPQTVTIAFNFQNEVYIGTEDGLVLKEFVGTSFNGEVINAYYKSPWFDWAGDYFHSFAEFAIDIAAEYNNNFYLRTFKDGDSPYEDRIIDDGALYTTGLIWDGGEDNYPYSIIIKSFPITEGGVTTYSHTCKIPDTDPDASQDTEYTVDENVYFFMYREGNDLIIKKWNPSTKAETDYMTLTDYYVDYKYQGHLENNYTQWDKDVWTSGSFDSIRMLLPNNVFETFQLEIGTNQLGQAFAIYGYNFRRLETEEAPW